MNREEFDIWQKGIYETINEASIIGLSQLKGDVGTHNNRTPEQIKANNEKKASLRAKAVEKMKSAASKAGEAIKNGAKAVAQKTGEVVNKAKNALAGKDDRPIGLSSLNKKPNTDSNSTHKPTPNGAGVNKGNASSTASKFAKGVQNAQANPAPQPKATAKAQPKAIAKASKKPNAPQLKTDDNKTVTDTVLKHAKGEDGEKKSLGQKLKDTAKKAIYGANDLKYKVGDAKKFVKDAWDRRDAHNKRVRGIKDEPKAEEKTNKAKENLNKKNNNPQQSNNTRTTASNSNSGSSNGGSTVHVHVTNHNDEHAQKNAQAKADAEKDREEFFKRVNHKSKGGETKAESGEETKTEATKTETTTDEPKAEEAKATKKEEKKSKEPKVAKAIKKTVAKKLKKGAEEKKNDKKTKAKGDEPTVKSDDKTVTKPANKEETKPQDAKDSKKEPVKKPDVIKDIPKDQQAGGKDLSKEPATKKLAPGEAKGSHGLQHKKTKGAEASMYDDEKGNPVPTTPAEQKAKDGDVGKHTEKKAIVVKKNKTEDKSAEGKKDEFQAEEKKDKAKENVTKKKSTPKVETKKEETKEDPKPEEKKEEPKEETKVETKKEEKKTEETKKEETKAEPKKEEKKAEVNDKGQKLLKYNPLPGQREKDKENASKVGNTKGGKEVTGKDEIEKHNNVVRYGEHNDKTSKMNKIKKRHNEHEGDSDKIEAHKALTKKMAEYAKTHSKEDSDKMRTKVKEVYKSKLSDREKKRGDNEESSKKTGLAKLAMKEKKKEKPAKKKDSKPKKISLANIGKKKD